jgi:hypothetical protein
MLRRSPAEGGRQTNARAGNRVKGQKPFLLSCIICMLQYVKKRGSG